jgi:hypothetical protein
MRLTIAAAVGAQNSANCRLALIASGTSLRAQGA